MFLLGSRALDVIFKPDANDDWDLLISEYEMFSSSFPLNYVHGIKYQGYKNKDSIDALVVTDENKECKMGSIYRELSVLDIVPIQTKIGIVKPVPLSIHKSFLLSIPKELRTEKQKKYLRCVDPINDNRHITDLLKKGFSELSEKNNFFAGYSKKRYVPHDRIHWWVSQALGLSQPTYLKIKISSVAISEDLFQYLSLQEKYAVLFEEAIVLTIERYLIKNAIESEIGLSELWETFSSCERTPIKNRLLELCSVGIISDHPKWLASWGNNHLLDMLSALDEVVVRCSKSMPESLFDYINYLRINIREEA